MIRSDRSIISNKKPLFVTLSFGVSSYQEGTNDWHTIAKSADDALYQAKKNGRNKVIAA
jgi:diguanylate cyclase (GGDEF)-like protein